MFRNVFTGCVSDRSSQTGVMRSQKLKFGASLSSALKHGYLPGPLIEILVHIAKEGIKTADVFRRPGNPNDTRRIVKRLTEGKQVVYANYSFYTLASVVKKFLLKIPGGVFTPEGEEQLLQVLSLAQKMEQIEAVHSFMETLAPAHQQLIALLFGTWFRIVTYQEQNCMSLEALSRSVAGSMFHTCAEDPAKVEKASRIMQFLIDNFGVESMFGEENIRFFAETTHTGINIDQLYRYNYLPESQSIPPLRQDVIVMARLENETDLKEDQDLDREKEFTESPQHSPAVLRHTTRGGDGSQHLINNSTLSAPEVSLVPSPDVSKRPKSLEDNLNEVRSHYQNRCLSRFNSVKRKQLERLRQRSDWFLSPVVRERNNSRKGKGDWGLSLYSNNNVQSSYHHHCHGNGNSESIHNSANRNHNGSSKCLQQKNSGNSTVTKASSENAVGEAFSDGDSVFTDNTSRSESPASEPVWSHVMKAHSRDVVLGDTIAELVPLEMSVYGGGSGADLSLDSHDSISGHHFMDLSPSLVRSSIVEEEEEGMKANDEDDDEDDDNTTPTDEEVTVMASSFPDLQLQSFTDGGLTEIQMSHPEYLVDRFHECIADGRMTQEEGASCFEACNPSHQTTELGENLKEDFLQRQQTQDIQSEMEQGAVKVDETTRREVEERMDSQEIKVLLDNVHCFPLECTYSDECTDS